MSLTSEAFNVHSSLDAGQILSCAATCQHSCWLDKRAWTAKPLSPSASLIPSVYTKALFNSQQQQSHLFCLCPGFFCFTYIFFIYFPRDTAQSVKEKFGKKLYNALLK